MPNIRPDQYVFVQGNVAWSRIASVIEGKELEDSIKNSVSQYPTNVPHTRMTLSNARVVYHDKTNPTPEETYVESRFYESKNQERQPGKSYSIDNRGQYLPAIFRKGNPDKGEVDKDLYQEYTKYELAIGTPVILMLHTYAGQGGNNGIGIDAVIVMDNKLPVFIPGTSGHSRIADAIKANLNATAHLAENQGEMTEAEKAEIAAKTNNVTVADTVAAAAPETPTVPSLDEIEKPLQGGITLDGLLG